MNRTAQALGRLAKGHPKMMTPAALAQRSAALERGRARLAQIRAKRKAPQMWLGSRNGEPSELRGGRQVEA